MEPFAIAQPPMRLLVRLVARSVPVAEDAVALALIWIWVAETMLEIVAPAGMFVPLTARPTVRPAVLGTVTIRVALVVPTEVKL